MNTVAAYVSCKPDLPAERPVAVHTVGCVFGDRNAERLYVAEEGSLSGQTCHAHIKSRAVQSFCQIYELPFRAADAKVGDEVQNFDVAGRHSVTSRAKYLDAPHQTCKGHTKELEKRNLKRGSRREMQRNADTEARK